MNRTRRTTEDGDCFINYNDTLTSIFGEKESRNHSELKEDSRYKQFQNKFREINKVSEKRLIPAGEALRLIVIQFGTSLENIQFGKLDEVRDFLEKNVERMYAFTEPELHSFLLRCGYYEKSKTSVAPKSMLAGYCSTVYSMMKNKCAKEQFVEFGIEVSKL